MVKGWTLVELMLVISISALLLILAIPNMLQTWPVFLAKRDIHTLSTAIQFARIQAITLNTNVTLCPTIDQINCTTQWDNTNLMVFDDSLGNGNTSSLLTLFPAVNKGARLTYNRGDRLSFQSNGQPPGLNGTFSYCLTRGRHHVESRLIINKAGRIRGTKVSRLAGC